MGVLCRGFEGEVGFIGAEVDGDGQFPGEVEALCVQGQLVDLNGGGGVPEDCREPALVDGMLVGLKVRESGNWVLLNRLECRV